MGARSTPFIIYLCIFLLHCFLFSSLLVLMCTAIYTGWEFIFLLLLCFLFSSLLVFMSIMCTASIAPQAGHWCYSIDFVSKYICKKHFSSCYDFSFHVCWQKNQCLNIIIHSFYILIVYLPLFFKCKAKEKTNY